MPPRFPPPGGDAVDALVTDQYLDALLASADRRPPDGAPDPAAGADLRRATAVLRASLVRVHPSFRFEERLAARLAELAAGDVAHAVAGPGVRHGDLIPFPGAMLSAPSGDPLLAAVLDGRLDPSDEEAVARAAGARPPARPLLVGGAITSAALSLVGVAWVAWRAARPGGPGLPRAAHESSARRLAELADLATGIHGGTA